MPDPPGVFLLGEGAGRHAGEVLGAQLAWSGSHRVEVTRLREGFWALSAGEAFAPGEMVLGPGETLRSPDLLVTWSGEGLNGASQAFHAAVRARMTWPGGRMRPRPVHLNSWEGLYFDQDEAKVMALAERAAALGVERFVLDDGWFRGRSSDRAGLGDWAPDPVKYPRGLGPLAARVAELGMEFGLWVEPEMVNPDSELYRRHPEWALGASLSNLPTARHQLVLDLSNAEVSGLPARKPRSPPRQPADRLPEVGPQPHPGRRGGRRRAGRLPPAGRLALRPHRRAARPASTRRDRVVRGRWRAHRRRDRHPHPSLLDQRQPGCAVAAGDPARLPGVHAAGADGRARRAESVAHHGPPAEPRLPGGGGPTRALRRRTRSRRSGRRRARPAARMDRALQAPSGAAALRSHLAGGGGRWSSLASGRGAERPAALPLSLRRPRRGRRLNRCACR